ncbi:MFS transporter [Methylopila jiangsuensis]|uniref:MFS transporter n=1 Tax=Methylopila jiangsuensis TaxID=586230 RepID=A0A9W6JJD6_9HYPH|nr:MFS transporter [Methylopila jiangsuensis]MDR6286819.1 YNFM family putative membrane transporter [Methylopila jiangsuensis]GLK76834.1 MFS transporter [Methylopila jiangsuensis]
MSASLLVPSSVVAVPLPVPAAPAAEPPRTPPPAAAWIARGTPAYARVSWGFFFVGFATFALVYCVQPVMPEFAASFGASPAGSSLALSLTTGFLAFSILISGAVSQAIGRRGLILGSMALGAGLNVAAGLSPSWHGLLAARALEGLALGGVPAVAMTYLAEEIEPKSLGRAMGLYIAGSAFGGLMGRVGMGLLNELVSWRGAMVVLGALCLICAALAWRLLPASRNFTAQKGLRFSHNLRAWRSLLRDPALTPLFAIGFVLTGVYVTIYNYAGFRLAEAPFDLGGGVISLIFLCVVFGIVSSMVSGALMERFGKRASLLGGFALILAGVALTAPPSLAAIVAGIACVTAGYFIAHPVASSMIGPIAGPAKAHAASLYLLFYYVGSSVVGSVGGWFWEHGGWGAVALGAGALSAAGLGAALVATAPAAQGRA